MQALDYCFAVDEALIATSFSKNQGPADKPEGTLEPTAHYDYHRISPFGRLEVQKKFLTLTEELQNKILSSRSFYEYFDRWIQTMMLLGDKPDEKIKNEFGPYSFRMYEMIDGFPKVFYIPLSRDEWVADEGVKRRTPEQFALPLHSHVLWQRHDVGIFSEYRSVSPQ
jgi:hypothetical protein